MKIVIQCQVYLPSDEGLNRRCLEPATTFYALGDDYLSVARTPPTSVYAFCSEHKIKTTKNGAWHRISQREYVIAEVMLK